MKIHAKNMNFIEYPKIQNIRWVFIVQNLCQFCECSFFQLLQIPWQKLIYNPKCQLDIAPPQTKLKVEWIWVSSCWSCSRWPIYSPNMSKSIRVDDLILPSFPPFVEDARKRIKEIENFPTRKDDVLLFNYPKSGKRDINPFFKMLYTYIII